MTLWLPDEAEPLPGVDAAQYGAVVRGAFARWSAVDCGSGQPSIDVRFGGELALECALTGYDEDALENVNTVRVVDENWPNPRGLRELALTTLTFDVNTGEILDADVEINAAQREFSLGDTAVADDLDGTLTHEAGHVLGLAHSDDLDATMFAKARTGSTNLRTLGSRRHGRHLQHLPARGRPEPGLQKRSGGQRRGRGLRSGGHAASRRTARAAARSAGQGRGRARGGSWLARCCSPGAGAARSADLD